MNMYSLKIIRKESDFNCYQELDYIKVLIGLLRLPNSRTLLKNIVMFYITFMSLISLARALYYA